MIVEEVKVVIKVETGMVDIGGIGIISRGRGDHVTPANTSKNVRMQQNKYKITWWTQIDSLRPATTQLIVGKTE